MHGPSRRLAIASFVVLAVTLAPSIGVAEERVTHSKQTATITVVRVRIIVQ